MNNIPNNAATKIQSLTRGHLARKAIKQQNNAATTEANSASSVWSIGKYLYNRFFPELLANEWVSDHLNTTNETAQNILIKLCKNELESPADHSLTKITSELIKKGANIHLKNNNGQSPLDIAKSNSGDNVTKNLLKAYLNNWVNEAPEEEREVRYKAKKQIKIDNGKLVVKGDLDLDLRYKNISSLPQDLHVGGNLDLRHCTSLTTLPQGLHVGRNLYLDWCTNLTQLPQGLHVGGNLDLTYCKLRELPQGLHVGGELTLGRCTSLTSLPQGLHVGGDPDRYVYTPTLHPTRHPTLHPNWVNLDQDVYTPTLHPFRVNLDLRGCTGLTELPQDLHVGGSLELDGCTSLTSLPQGLHVRGDLTLDGCTSLTTLPQGLHVGGDLTLGGCTSLETLPQGLTVGGNLNLFRCTSLTELPDWVFNVSDLSAYHLKQTDTYKTFQILKHFDTHNTIDEINNQELIDLYNQNQDRINLLKHDRHCFRIAYSLCNKKELTPQQITFKDNANEETKNQIRDYHVHIITSFRPNMFKKLPGINKAESLPRRVTSIYGLEILPFVANFGFLSASETQGLRRVCKSFNERDILDQTRAFSLEAIEQILQD